MISGSNDQWFRSSKAQKFRSLEVQKLIGFDLNYVDFVKLKILQ